MGWIIQIKSSECPWRLKETSDDRFGDDECKANGYISLCTERNCKRIQFPLPNKKPDAPPKDKSDNSWTCGSCGGSYPIKRDCDFCGTTAPKE